MLQGIYPPTEIRMKPGDSIFVYTDGVPEAGDAEHNQFGVERMLAALNGTPETSPEETLARIRNEVDGFVKKAAQFDDLTMLGMKYKENQ